jgi:4,5-DOPA dioxygenase extradiol
MNRKDFLKWVAALPLAGAAVKLSALQSEMLDEKEQSDVMPLLFLGHGSPMNAIEENEFVAGFRSSVVGLDKPKAILCVSAHWETRGTMITAMEKPKTIHDFGGFPPELFAVQYPAVGSPEWAKTIQNTIQNTAVKLDYDWGLDHGSWSVLKHLYPNADVPVLQMSLDINKTPEQHYQLAKELASLRKKGILIVGSGNIVHNLGAVAWDKMNVDNYGFDWAIEANSLIKGWISKTEHEPIWNYKKQNKSLQYAVPTPEHFLPLLYVLALQDKNDKISFFNDKSVGGSLSMTSVKIEQS